MKYFLWLFALTFFHVGLSQVTPLVGHITNNSVIISGLPDTISKNLQLITYSKKSSQRFKTAKYHTNKPYKYELKALHSNTTYTYYFIVDDSVRTENFYFATKSDYFLHSKKKFSFYFGSCMYVNDSLDTYGKGTEVLQHASNADFFFFGGDHTYYRGTDYSSSYQMRRRWWTTRQDSNYQELTKTIPQYFIWDDHDYGPNNANSTFELKDSSLTYFSDFTCNPTSPSNGTGNYYQFDYQGVSFFALDNRSYRTSDSLDNSVYLGNEQYEWLTAGLKNSKQDFKLIVSGSQISNQSAFDEAMCKSQEYYDLLSFIVEHKIEGVVFLSGDRHFSEILLSDTLNTYTITEFTSSPISSRAFTPWGEYSQEKVNPQRIKSMVNEQNIARITIYGIFGRKMKVEYINKSGTVVLSHTIKMKNLRF